MTRLPYAARLAVTLPLLLLFCPKVDGHSLLPAAGDMVNPPELAVDRDNAKASYLIGRAGQVGLPSAQAEAARSFVYSRYKWSRTNLTVCFWNGTEDVQRKVMEAASSWLRAAPVLSFDFERDGKVRLCNVQDIRNPRLLANIRINLDAADPRPLWGTVDALQKTGDWSYPGKLVSENPDHPTTMNLPSVTAFLKGSSFSDFDFTVRHEFGHALALVHEHQRSTCAGWFNIPQMSHDLIAMTHNPQWTPEYTKTQVDTLPETGRFYSVIGPYDVMSVMQYNFDPSWYMPDRPGQPNPCRRRDSVDDLSEMDKVVIASMYQPELNKTPDRVAFITRAEAAAAPLAAVPTAATQKADVEQALLTLRQRAGLLQTTAIQVFPHPADKDLVLKAVGNLGYPLKDEHGQPIVRLGHPTRGLEVFPTNTLLFTRDVQPEDVRYVALSLLRAGIGIKSIQPYYPSVNNHFTSRSHLIQVGADVTNRDRSVLSEQDILTSPLPIYGKKP